MEWLAGVETHRDDVAEHLLAEAPDPRQE